MGHRAYCVASGVIFFLVALAHLLRIVYGFSIQVADFAVPMLGSWIGMIVAAGLAVWSLRVSRGSGGH